jgi:hypothetical protein
MGASHLVAGEDIEDGDGEEADAGGDEDRVEHVLNPSAKCRCSSGRNSGERGIKIRRCAASIGI